VNMFQYLRPASVQDAAQMIREQPEARFLAGGMSLLSAMKLRLAAPSHLVDLAAIDGLSGIAVVQDELVIGAMARHADVARSAQVRQLIPALAHLAGGIGDRQVRNRGTIGGSVANADPAACYPAAVLGLDATVVTSKRRIAADDFFGGLFETALEPGELITEVRFPIPKAAAYVKFPQPASRFALVGVMAVIDRKGEPRVAVTGARASVYRVSEFEAVLRNGLSSPAVLAIRLPEDDMNNDLHADAGYRAHLVSVIAARAIDGLNLLA
jgi:carbon-monoxide dehydrogenase medium subunit